ncbi:uncharacterized protein LOC117106666 [Anneissia japonica]|uniref:uncharacterized protein LOC117106666 n=1 Tax=Anneissia japonica TaxID=1529436 RepID=UPI00142598E0|nr:uncharacterized protein LOC117106666 [Anneissia japonica]
MNTISSFDFENGEPGIVNEQPLFGSPQIPVSISNQLCGRNSVACCKGNILTEKDKRIQLVKMFLLSLIPILSLTLLAALDIGNIVNNSSIDGEVRNAIIFSRDIGVLLSRLQKERDMSALFASPIRPEDNDFLTETYPLTDTALENLEKWPIKTSVLEALPFFNEKQDLKQHLAWHRETLSSTNTTIYEEIYFYTELLQIFIDWLYESVGNSKGHGMWTTLVAYQLLVVSNVDTGIERTLGTVFFAQGIFDKRSDYVWYLDKYNVGTWYFQASMGYSERIAHLYKAEIEILDQNITQTVDELRNIILKNNNNKTGKTSGISVTRWFDIMTIYINIREKVQKNMAQDILDRLNHEIDKDTESMAVSVSLVVAVTILCPLTLRAISKMTTDIQTYALTLAAQTKKLNEEKERSNWLLYSMLPKSVAEQLMYRKDVKAEYFDLVTVLFSDLVGFNKLCSISAPLQVVEMLNGLYMMIDTRIERYDVCKVETINETYMLASGLPNRNGFKHASEIATAAIDILYHINTLAVPAYPNRKFSIRIGIHTGPVVAGVVGLKMPRYGLFGDTVNIASHMQTNGMGELVVIGK